MIYEVLQKCLVELNKDEVDFSYIKGMLEVLLAMQEKPRPLSAVQIPPSEVDRLAHPVVTTDEAAILDAKARAAIEQVKAMSNASTE